MTDEKQAEPQGPLDLDGEKPELNEKVKELLEKNENVMLCCGRMGPMCLPVYDVMESLEDRYENVAFRDMAFDGPAALSRARGLGSVSGSSRRHLPSRDLVGVERPPTAAVFSPLLPPGRGGAGRGGVGSSVAKRHLPLRGLVEGTGGAVLDIL